MIAATVQSESTAELVRRIRCGDRAAAGLFVRRYEDLIRARYRRRLSPALRRLADSSDLVSTVARRLDAMLARGGVEIADERQLWGLVHGLANRAVADKARLLARLRAAEEWEADWSRGFLARAEAHTLAGADGFEVSVNQALDALGSDVDRQVLAMWLNGSSHEQIAAHLGVRGQAVRQRWRRIREQLRKVFGEGAGR